MLYNYLYLLHLLKLSKWSYEWLTTLKLFTHAVMLNKWLIACSYYKVLPYLLLVQSYFWTDNQRSFAFLWYPSWGLSPSLTHTHTHTHSLYRGCCQSGLLSSSVPLWYCISLSPSLGLIHTHTHTHSRIAVPMPKLSKCQHVFHVLWCSSCHHSLSERFVISIIDALEEQ